MAVGPSSKETTLLRVGQNAFVVKYVEYCRQRCNDDYLFNNSEQPKPIMAGTSVL